MSTPRNNHEPDPGDLILDAQALSAGTLIDLGPLHVMFQGHPVNRMTEAAFESLRPSNEELQNHRQADAIWRLFEEVLRVMIDRAEFRLQTPAWSLSFGMRAGSLTRRWSFFASRMPGTASSICRR
jgi:hypothetical protein